jgi:hypothetical protein
LDISVYGGGFFVRLPKKLDTQHAMVWLCPPTTSAFAGAIWIEGFAVK